MTSFTRRGHDVPGSTVVVRLRPGSAGLLSRGSQQGYEASGVVRRPAATAQVTFGFGQRSVTMLISCPNGGPSATTHQTGGNE